jgi:hypothetical protein
VIAVVIVVATFAPVARVGIALTASNLSGCRVGTWNAFTRIARTPLSARTPNTVVSLPKIAVSLPKVAVSLPKMVTAYLRKHGAFPAAVPKTFETRRGLRPTEDILIRFVLEYLHIPYDAAIENKDVPYNSHERWEYCTWDGHALHVDYCDNRSDALHEIAHWLVSSRARRALPNYGLGTGNSGKNSLHELLGHRGQREEERASILGIEIERAFHQEWERTFINHQWDNADDPALYAKCRAWLSKRFLLLPPPSLPLT